MSDRLDALDHQPGNTPDVRMVGTSVLVVMTITDASPADTVVRLVLRLESNGELFAAITHRSSDPSGS